MDSLNAVDILSTSVTALSTFYLLRENDPVNAVEIKEILPIEYLSTLISVLSTNFYLIKNDTMNIVEIKEVLPIEYSKAKKVRHFYKRIKVQELSTKKAINHDRYGKTRLIPLFFLIFSFKFK